MADKRKKSTLKDAEDCQDTPEPEPEPEPVYGNGSCQWCRQKCSSQPAAGRAFRVQVHDRK
jgi:hypothetical protein